jgi:hypothetical protein
VDIITGTPERDAVGDAGSHRAPGLADSSRTLADFPADQADPSGRRAAARNSVGVMPIRCRNARLNGPIDP